LQAVELLLVQGADVNAKSPYNDQTPLHVAAGIGNPEVVKLLLAHGAEVDARENYTFTPFDYDSYLQTPLHIAAVAGRREVIEILLAHKADINARIQVQENKYRITSGAWGDVYNPLSDLGNLKDITPLHLAAYMGHRDVVEVLLSHGAEKEAKDSHGRTPLHFTSFWDHTVEAAERLLVHGSEADAREETGATPLHLAVIKSHKPVVKLLLDYGADVNAKDKGNDTALRFAERQGNTDMIEFLRRHGAKE
ncbi:MAG TPA: ankyrin repeat domain-containing protein, partial [Candidatus Binatia bacterium]|nr:ankyrin repeat domain-containing protein [Candidatus Binatia bacterium]